MRSCGQDDCNRLHYWDRNRLLSIVYCSPIRMRNGPQTQQMDKKGPFQARIVLISSSDVALMKPIPVCCSVLQCVAVCCSVLQCVDRVDQL